MEGEAGADGRWQIGEKCTLRKLQGKGQEEDRERNG